jgi:hypothetical protein
MTNLPVEDQWAVLRPQLRRHFSTRLKPQHRKPACVVTLDDEVGKVEI